MNDTVAAAIVQAVLVYVGSGLVVSVPLVWFGLPRIDPAARHATWGFRVIVVPGVALFWPLLLTRLITGASDVPIEQNAHRRRATGAAR